jgi:outer membrane receptor protein involved in Fe transport
MIILESNHWTKFVGGVLLTYAGLMSYNVLAQEDGTSTQDDTKILDKVVITGSRIARTQVEGPSPVVIIDRAQIEREGFTTVQDVLKSLTQANGVVQNELKLDSFTQNANSIDLRGLGPGRLLLLIDGRRASDYPLAYNGQSNIVNIAALPLVAVDRIEILSGGASAIYGSDAVAGVVNIILRRDLGNSLDMNVRVGDTKDGGFETTRFQAVGGFLGSSWNVTYAFEFMQRDPLFAYQRDYMDSNDDNPIPSGRNNSFNAIEVNLFQPFFNSIGAPATELIDPGPTACDPFDNQVYATIEGRGSYCGNKTINAETTLINGRDQANVYTAASIELGDSHELYGTFNYFQVDAEVDSGFRFWQLAAYDPSSPDPWLGLVFGPPGAYHLTQRRLTNEEFGGPNLWTVDEEVIDYSIGLRGELFSPLWAYDLIYSHSGYELEDQKTLIVDQAATDYFYTVLATEDDCLDPFGFCFPVATLNRSTFFSPITPQVWDSITDQSTDIADTSNDVVTAVIRGDLFDMPAGPVAMAAVLEWGQQDYDIAIDQQIVDGGYFFGITGTGGGGERDRTAFGAEFQLPLHEKLNLSLAGRWDEYDIGVKKADAVTYNVGLEYRPFRQLLVRGSRSTSFRAPDMHYLFAAPSGFFTTVDDEYLCRRDEPGTPIDACTNSNVNIAGTRVGKPLLEEEEGDSFTFGFVLEPTDSISMSVDYYDIELNQAVVDNPLARILELEADCRLGIKDINSGECVDAVGRVTRNPADDTIFSEQIDSVDTGPVNATTLEVEGVDATFTYSYETITGATFGFDLSWSHQLHQYFAVFPEDPLVDIRDRGTRDWRSRVRGSINWDYKDWSGTLFGERFGSALSDDNIDSGVGRDLGPIWNFNLSLGYSFMDGKANIGLIINNLFDEGPKVDVTNGGWPYFDPFYYGQFVIGRTTYLQARYRFDY